MVYDDKNDVYTFSILADYGPPHKLGENSTATNEALGLQVDDPKGNNGRDPNNILYSVFAGSRSKWAETGKPWSTGGEIPNNEQIKALGSYLYKQHAVDRANSTPAFPKQAKMFD